jgi:hypothetical protein
MGHRSPGIHWSSLMSRVIRIPPTPVNAPTEEPFDAFSNRLSMVGKVALVMVAIVPVGIMACIGVVVSGHRVRVTTVMSGGNRLKI